MITSMTGYGSAQSTHEKVAYAVEIRSVNHRYLKLSIKVPDHLQFAESEVDTLLRRKVSRGSIHYALRVRSESAGALRPINLDVVQNYVDQLSRAKLPTGTQATIDLAAVALLPGASDPLDWSEDERQRITDTIKGATSEALDAMHRMRAEEGRALAADLKEHATQLRDVLASIAKRAPNVVEEYHERLRARVSQLLEAAKLELEKDALAREVAIYAERCDIAEEISRIHSHLDQFDELCARDEPVGRTLDFLAQELLREANTIGSKSSDAEIARHVVQMKGLIDRLKEQVQNVE